MEGLIIFSYILGLVLGLYGLVNSIIALFIPSAYDYLELDTYSLRKKRSDDRDFGVFLIVLGIMSALHWVLAIIVLVIVIISFVTD